MSYRIHLDDPITVSRCREAVIKAFDIFANLDREIRAQGVIIDWIPLTNVVHKIEVTTDGGDIKIHVKRRNY